MLILIIINILDIVLNLIEKDFFSHPGGGTGRNVINLWVDISSLPYIDNKKNIF